MLRSVPLLSRWFSPKLGSSLAKYLYLADALRTHAISLVLDVTAIGESKGDAELAVTRSSGFSSLHAPVAVPQFSEQNVVAGRQPVICAGSTRWSMSWRCGRSSGGPC